MAVDESLSGRTFPPTSPYAVSREKIVEFAHATGATYEGGEARPRPPSRSWSPSAR